MISDFNPIRLNRDKFALETLYDILSTGSSLKGGWGYSKEDAFVFLKEDIDTLNIQNMIIKLRNENELWQSARDKETYQIIRIILEDEMIFADTGKIYEVLYLKVVLFPKKELEKNIEYDEDKMSFRVNLVNIEKNCSDLITSYTAECWFDITKPFPIITQKLQAKEENNLSEKKKITRRVAIYLDIIPSTLLAYFKNVFG
ncbi:MAG: hypothetical protein K0B81_03295 [Candidatus Cloacimonetes bacterium]|nr:hypothetical protein [Candidatus Cloacimonadota bacterium]